jgi:tRNA G18 (ribose-2'-O)-methylase SpoU
MRGYFGVGVEHISKEQNVGTIARSAHAFGASFFFTIQPDVDIHAMRATDTSDAFEHLPYYQYDSVEKMDLPMECQLVGVELTDEAIELPTFRHPSRAAYVFGPEMGHLSEEMQEQCSHIIKIPMKFCVNVGVAAAITMYDRQISMGRFAERPVKAGGPIMKRENTHNSLRRKIRNPKT